MKKTGVVLSLLIFSAVSLKAQTLAPLAADAWGTLTPAAAPLPAASLPALGSLLNAAPLDALAPLPAAPVEALAELPALSGGGIEGFAAEAQRLFGSPQSISKRGAVRALAAPGDREISDNVAKSPTENAERERVIQELFVKAGAQAADIKSFDIGEGHHNFMVVKKGRTDKVLIVGGHHDKVSVGNGVIDNWTGATMVVHLYQLLKDVDTEHTIIFMTFGREEEGLVGSRKYVESLSAEEKGRIDAMVNLDTLGVDGTYSWKNNSDKKLLDAVAQAAKTGGYALEPKYLDGGDADSSSFRDAGIPAITIFGASPDIIFDIIHTERDNFEQFSLAHYKNAFLLTGALLRQLDAAPSRSLAPAGSGR